MNTSRVGEAVQCHVHVAGDRSEKSLQPFIGSGIGKVAGKDL